MKELEALNHRKVDLSDIVAKTPVEWPKRAPSEWEDAIKGAEVIYEDHQVVAFHETEDDPLESPRIAGEIRVTLMPKRHVHSLLDLGVADEHLNAALLFAIQQVAYKLGLHQKGFEVRAHVLPPYQHRPGLVYKIRAGKPPKSSDEAAG
jgi:hypothetical protein